MAELQVAVLIDFENVGLAAIRPLFDQLSDVGRVIIKRAYGDWSQGGSANQDLQALGIEPIQNFHSSSSGKNSSDIRLAIDAIDLLHQAPADVFVIVSADSDFVPLVTRLRSGGKMVIGAGPRDKAPEPLVNSCDRFIILTPLSPLKKQNAGATQRGLKQESLIIRAVKSSMDLEGKVVGAKLHNVMQRLDPSFDYRALGFSSFTKYLDAQPEIKVTKPKGPGDVVVELRG